MTRIHHLETPRLELAPFAPADRAGLHRVFTDAHVRRYLLDDALVGLDWVDDEIETSQARFAAGSAGLWSVRERGAAEIVGFTGFRPFFDPPELQLLYGLLPDRWGGGLATEAARAAVAHAFGAFDFTRIVAAADRPNEPSIRLMRRLGMRFDRETKDGQWGTVFYTVAREDWS